MTVRPGAWNVWDGIWFQVLPDPLAGAETVAVTVHVHGADLWVYVKGANGGVHFQTVAPDTADARSADQEHP